VGAGAGAREPDRVATTMTSTRSRRDCSHAIVGEPITPNLVFGLVAVFAGIWIATSQVKPAGRELQERVTSGRPAGYHPVLLL